MKEREDRLYQLYIAELPIRIKIQKVVSFSEYLFEQNKDLNQTQKSRKEILDEILGGNDGTV